MERLKKHLPTLNIVEVFKIPPEYHDWDDKGDFYGVFTKQKVMFVFFVPFLENHMAIEELVPFFWSTPIKKLLDKKAAEFLKNDSLYC
jgi:hypothetical protein